MEDRIPIDIKDIQLLLGEKDLIIFQLQKELEKLREQLQSRPDVSLKEFRRAEES
jgi:hypothetical protein